MRHDMNRRDDAAMIQSRPRRVEAMFETREAPRKRPETDSDAAFVFLLYESVKGAEMSMFDAGIRSQLLHMQFNAMTSSYRAAFPAADYYKPLKWAVVRLDA